MQGGNKLRNAMSKMHHVAAITGVLALLLTTTTTTLAQNQTTPRNRGQNQDQNNNNNNNQSGRRQRGNFDPAQFQQRMVDRYRERLEITDDAEWKAIQPRIQKILEARMALESGRRAMFDRGNRGDRGGRGNNSDQNQQRATQPADSATETLQRAITEKASNSDLKTAAAQYAAARKAKQGDLEKVQEELRMVLTQRQEAIAMLAGLL
jgi:uncharacterized protein (DUF305 family)